MRKPTRYIEPLTEKQRSALKAAMKSHPNARARMRAHAVLLSDRKYSISQIADIYEVDRDSVSAWLKRWERGSLDSLGDDPRSGRPATLSRGRAEGPGVVRQRGGRASRVIVTPPRCPPHQPAPECPALDLAEGAGD